MASPPPYSVTSPPGPAPLVLPKRPSLALPGGSAVKSRKPSVASTTSSAHPLRQTSFPPPDSLEAQHAAAEDAALRFSPSQASQGSLEDEFSDTEIASAIDTPADGEEGRTRKRKRGEKKARGRPPKRGGGRAGSASLVNGEDGRSTRRGGTAGAASVLTGDNADDEDDNEDDEEVIGGGRLPLYEGGQMSTEELRNDNEHRSLFRRYMDVVDAMPLTAAGREGMTVRDMGDRMDVWNRAKLRTADVRRLVNQTLSQSVPATVVTVVSSYTKMFAGLLIEEARAIQAEWLAVEQKRADGKENPAYVRLKKSSSPVDGGRDVQSQQSGHRQSSQIDDQPQNSIKHDSTSSQTQPNTQSNDHQDQSYTGGAGGLQTSIEECDRGPLLPDHLREALRRYKKARTGGTVGFTGLSLEGREVAASRMGGRRLFR